MAHEIGPPHNRAILLFTVLAVITLVGLHFVFTSYFHAMVGAELSEKVDTVPPREYNRLVREQQIQLSQGPLPLEQAIDQLTSAGRRGIPFVRPEPSEDLQALAGWMHHPSYKPPAEPAAPSKDEPDVTPSSEASPVAPANGLTSLRARPPRRREPRPGRPPVRMQGLTGLRDRPVRRPPGPSDALRR